MLKNQEEFESNIRDVFGSSGEQWLRDLPKLLAELKHDWNFILQETVPRLTYSFVTKVKTSTGKDGILKLSPVGPRCHSEIAWFESNSVGTPQLWKSDLNRGAMLMEQIIPGYSAKKWVQERNDVGATRAIADVIRTLKPGQNHSQIFKPVTHLASSLECLRGKIDPKLLSKAETLFKELTADSSKDRLLHGDLHHDNILFAGDKWVAIDPHGYIGPAAFEAGAMIRNPYDCFPKEESLKKILETRLKVLKDELPFEPYEIHGWAFAYTIMATGWSVADHGEIPKIHIEIAETLNEIVM